MSKITENERRIRTVARKVHDLGRKAGLATVEFATVIHDEVSNFSTKQTDIATWAGKSTSYVSNMKLAGAKLALSDKFTPDDQLAIVNTAAGKRPAEGGGDRAALKVAETAADVLKAVYAERTSKPGKTLAEQLTAVVEKVSTQATSEDSEGVTPELAAAISSALKNLTHVAKAIESGTVKVA